MAEMFYEEYNFQASLATSVIYIFISIITVSGNLLVIVAFIKDPLKELRTPQNYLIINLAVSDLLMGLIADPALVMYYWENSLTVGYIHYLCAVISAVSGILTITCLSVCRYIVLTRPLSYRAHITSSRVLWSMPPMWVYTIHFAVLPLVGWRDSAYQTYLYMLGAIIPTIFINLTYIGIWRMMKTHTKMMKEATLNTSDLGSDVTLRVVIMREKSTTKTLLIVFIVFLTFWAPLLSLDFVLVNCVACRTDSLHRARDIALTVTYLSSAVNPFLYAWRMSSFRRAVRYLIGLLCTSGEKQTLRSIRNGKIHPVSDVKFVRRVNLSRTVAWDSSNRASYGQEPRPEVV